MLRWYDTIGGRLEGGGWRVEHGRVVKKGNREIARRLNVPVAMPPVHAAAWHTHCTHMHMHMHQP